MNQFTFILVQLIIILPTLKTQSNDRINMTTQFYQCDETNDCSGKEIICTFTHGSCHIECKTPNSCRNTVMRSQMLNTYQHLAVRCSMNNSCPNATIFDTIRVEGYGSNALESVTVNCLYGSSCQIICDNENTCLNATIKGTYTTEVDVKCNAYQSCHNIDVYCPPSGANYFNCEIHGNSDELYDIHTDFNIYGPNGWADIWFDNYNAYVIGGNFICGGEHSWQGFFVGNGTESYSCSIEYGLWDCKDPTSPCTNQVYFADNREYFIIDDDEIDGTYLECKQFDDSVLYPVTMWSACNLICRGDNTCQNVEFACTALSKKQCNVICSGANSCNGLVLNNFSMPTSHPSFSSSDINVLCGNDNACQNSYISPPDKMMSLTTYRVNLFGENNLIGSVVNCSGLYSSATCDIRCQNDLSCKSGTVSTPMFVDIDIQCNGNSNSCSDMTIHCSKYGECRIRGLSVDENTNFHIFSRESWVNVFLDEWYNKSIIGNKNTMHCGIEYGNEYNNTCVIDNNWNCTCLVYPTSTPTDAVIADAVIDKDLYILADKPSEEIEVKAIATFDSYKSGVDGTVQVDENGNVFINLDLRNLDSSCDELTYGIYNKFEYKDLTSINGDDCTNDIIGEIFNPFNTASCGDYNGDKYFECSIGDLSGRFGNGIVDNNNEIVIEGNISQDNNDKSGGFCVSRLTPQALYQRSIVFKCAHSGDILFCAPFEIKQSGGTEKCKELGETCETRDDCCDSQCVDLTGEGKKECYLE